MAVAPTPLSTFEVLFTPQLPTGIPVPIQVSQINENVVKGFFLTISNPNNTSYVFTVGFHCNTNPAAPVPERTLAKAIGFIDDGTTAIPATLNVGSVPTDFYVTVTVGARGTVLLGIIPLFFSMMGFVSPAIDCRGWVDITLPPVFKRFGQRPFFFPTAQSNTPVTIIVTPEQRLTFIPRPGDAATAVEAQSAFALPVAGGSSSLSVPPQPHFAFTTKVIAELEVAGAGLEGRVAAVPPVEQFALLSALVAASPAVSGGKRKTEELLHELGFTGG